ncbi:MAG TPA: UvrD-helicase domain-containing protein [Burkholderiales bacterium]|nr:UvrD-helicase domain-containing protein [Burkholderiales bacterium]
MSPRFLEGLNEQQLEAVTLPHQSALVLAGAGSGKTRVLTTRIAWLIQTGQVSPQGLLAVTFTNKAAKEMLTRIAAMLPINTRGMWVGTFHGLCNRLLRAHHREAGLPQLFQILDTQDQLALIKRLMKTLNLDEERYPPRQAQWYIAGNKEEGRRAHEAEIYDDFTRGMQPFYAAYDELCQREGVVDFAELLLRTYELLERNALLRAHYASRFQHILVDEFQDTNRLQYRWLQLLAGVSPRGAARPPAPFPGATPSAEASSSPSVIFAVGDDDQSIYAFRGASAANMHDLQRDFHIERVIRLEQNYRSHGHILDAANALIRHNRKRLGKNLWTSEGKGELLRVYEAATDLDEAAFIVDEVKALNAEGVDLHAIAVLYRSNAQSRVLEHALFSAGVAYRVYGGLRFFERQEVKHALAYLRLMANRDDDNAFLRIVNFPARGIGTRTIEQLQALARERGVSLWAAAREKTHAAGARADAKGVPHFVALIERMRAATEALPLAETIDHAIDASGLRQHYKSEKEGTDRLENLGELVNAAASFVAERDVQPAGEGAEIDEPDELTAFLAHAALEAGEHQAEAGSSALQLMTAHSAKGLEFHAVFVSGLEEDMFPHENSLTEADGIEEERRLMYVALTRARRRLYLSLAQSRMLHGQTRYGVASRFFREIPETLMRRINAAPRLRHQPFAAPATSGVRVFSPSAADPGIPWRIGQNVVHPKFGAGVIVSAEGRGADARVQVNFRDNGLKWLVLEYAKLAAA